MATVKKYPLFHRILHWMMAVAIIGLLAVGIYMSDLPKESDLRPWLYGLHKSFGVTVLGLAILRLISRTILRMPALPRGLKAYEKSLSHMVHVLLYVVMFAMPISGIVMSNAFGHGVGWFGLVDLPRVIGENKEIGGLARDAHEYIAFAAMGLIALHFIGALKHRFFDKKPNNVLPRMM